MNWQDDPAVQDALELQRARNRILRSAVIWTPFFVVSLAGLVFFFFDRLLTGGDNGGTWFLVVVLGVLTFLFGFQSIQSLLDIFGHVHESTGLVTRRWSRTDSLVMRSHYFRLDNKQIFHVDTLQHREVKEGDRVRVRYYPHSSLVVKVEKLVPEEEENSSLSANS
jgi:hypothetical protein